MKKFICLFLLLTTLKLSAQMSDSLKQVWLDSIQRMPDVKQQCFYTKRDSFCDIQKIIYHSNTLNKTAIEMFLYSRDTLNNILVGYKGKGIKIIIK